MQGVLTERRVLIIDDEEDFARSLADVVKAEGYLVALAHSAADSIRALEESPSDVVVLDVNLSDGNGVKLMQTLQGAHPDLVFIVMTAYATTDSVIDALRERAYDYLRKPVAPRSFLLTLARCFESIALRRKTEETENQLAARNAELETLNERLRRAVSTATKLTGADDPEATDELLLQEIAQNVNAEGGSLFYVRDGYLERAHAIDPAHVPESIKISNLADNSLMSMALGTGVPQFIGDLSKDTSIRRSGWSGYRDGSALVFPLLGDGGEPFGVVTLHNRTRPPFTAQDFDIGTIIVSVATEVLRKRKAAQALKSSETRFRGLVEKSSDITTVVDSQGVIRYESPSVQTILGWDSGDLTGSSVLDFVHADERLWIQRIFGEHLKEPGAVIRLQHRFRDKNGNFRILQSNATNLLDSPEIAGLVINSRDVTASRELEERLQIIFEHAPDALYLTDLEGTFVDGNRAAQSLTGYDHDGLIGRAMTTCGVLREQDVHRMAGLLKRSAAGERTGPDEFILVRADGTEATAEIQTHPVEIGGKTYVLSVARDITSRRITELALSDTETKYKALFDAAGDGIMILDEGRFVDCNQSACEIFRRTRDEIVGKTPVEFSPEVQPDGRPSFEAASEKIDEALSADTPIRFQWRHTRGNGGSIDAEITLSRIVLNDKPNVQAIVRDITERKRAEERERQHDRELFQAAKMVSLGTLVSGVAHEINNPNNFIRLSTENFADLWQDISAILRRADESLGPVSLKGIPLETAERMVNSIINGLSEGSVRIENLVRSLREYAQHDGGELDQPVDLNAVVESAQTIVRSVLEKSTAHYTFAPAPELPSVTGNFHQIEQVVINLLANACQALDSPDAAVHVLTGHDAESSRVFVEVHDEGEGISEENLLRITDPFFTTKRDIGGTGLGLSVSQRIVRNHGGELTFSSAPGNGTYARFALPAQSLT